MKLQVQVPEGDEYLKTYYNTLQKAHKDDAGIDLVAPYDMNVYPFQTAMLNLQIKCCLRSNENELISYWLVPRSSIYKTGMWMANSIGLIDASYRGNIGVPLRYIPSNFGYLLENALTSLTLIFTAIFLNWTLIESNLSISLLGLALLWFMFLPSFRKLTEPYKIKKGDRLVQICASNMGHIDIEVVETLPESTRGTDGFGSTGK